MKDLRRLTLGAAIALLAAACSSDSAPSEPTPGSEPALAVGTIPGQHIVVFQRDVADAPALARRIVQEEGGTLRFSYQHAIKGFSAELSDAAVERIRRRPEVQYVAQNGRVTTAIDQSPATWGLDRIDQRDLPLNNIYTYNTTAAGVRAYILDTGLRFTHNEYDGASANRAVFGFDAIGDGQNGNDCNGHGTHVGGTVGGTTYGVAKAVTLVAVRVLNCGGSGSFDQVIAGVDWVTGDHDPGENAVANMSLTGGFNQPLNDAVTASIADGVFYSLAAGNNGSTACSFSPASTPNAMTVGATDINDTEASFSNFGTCVDILAPGVNVTSAWNTSDNATNTISGTSMAAPHVAGVGALYLAANPGHSPSQVTSAIKNAGTANTITLVHGTSTPNLFVFSLLGDAPPPPTNQPPVSSFTAACTMLSCSFTNTSTDPNGVADIVESRWTYGNGVVQTLAGRANGSQTYARPGTYVVELRVKDAAGLTHTSSQNVRVRRLR
jgi:subtilisin family serine protease